MVSSRIKYSAITSYFRKMLFLWKQEVICWRYVGMIVRGCFCLKRGAASPLFVPLKGLEGSQAFW